jgi:hypothetical protein
MMKKLFFIVVLCFSSAYITFAQYAKIGITAGMEISNYSAYFGEDVEMNLRSRVGAKIGFVGELALSKHLFIVPEFIFVQHGCQEDEYMDVDSVIHLKYTERVNYMQIPINALIKVNLSKDVQFLTFTGPYIGYAYSGFSYTGPSRSDIKFSASGEEGKYNRFDLGWNFGAGLEYADYFLKVQYNVGLSNIINRTADDNYSYIKTRNVGISLGFLF